jgi:hypothetical protein
MAGFHPQLSGIVDGRYGAILRIRRSPEIGSLATKPDLYAAAAAEGQQYALGSRLCDGSIAPKSAVRLTK